MALRAWKVSGGAWTFFVVSYMVRTFHAAMRVLGRSRLSFTLRASCCGLSSEVVAESISDGVESNARGSLVEFWNVCEIVTYGHFIFRLFTAPYFFRKIVDVDRWVRRAAILVLWCLRTRRNKGWVDKNRLASTDYHHVTKTSQSE